MEPAGASEAGSAGCLPGGGLISPNQGGASFLHPLLLAWKGREGQEAGGPAPAAHTASVIPIVLSGVPGGLTHHPPLRVRGVQLTQDTAEGLSARERHTDTSPQLCPLSQVPHPFKAAGSPPPGSLPGWMLPLGSFSTALSTGEQAHLFSLLHSGCWAGTRPARHQVWVPKPHPALRWAPRECLVEERVKSVPAAGAGGGHAQREAGRS